MPDDRMNTSSAAALAEVKERYAARNRESSRLYDEACKSLPGGNTRSVLFFGTQGTGPFCYGEGTDQQGLAGSPTPDGTTWCYDPDDSSKGNPRLPLRAGGVGLQHRYSQGGGGARVRRGAVR